MRYPATTYTLTFAGTTRPTWWSALVLLVVATFGIEGCAEHEPSTPLSPRAAVAPPAGALSQKSVEQSERRVTQLPDGRVLEQLHGEPAYRHLKELMARRPGAFANLSLSAKGYRPTGEVVVQKVKRPDRVSLRGDALRGDGFFMLAQDMQQSNAEGEIVLWSWDDGDDGTWEGVIYFEDYQNAFGGTNEGQYDVSTEAHENVWLENTYEYGDPTLTEPVSNPARCATTGVTLASLDVGSEWVARGYTLASYGRFIWRDWGRCTVRGYMGGCAGAATGCMFSGPGWAKCTGSWCAGAVVASALGCAADQFLR